MRHHFLVLHFGAQCPWHRWVIKQAQRAARKLNAKVSVKDVTNQPALAKKYRMFFPFMTVIDDRIRMPSPVRAEALVQMIEGTFENKPASPMVYGRRVARAEIRSLTPGRIKATIPLCIGGVHPIAYRDKTQWAKEILNTSDCPLGFIACKGGRAMAAVEYLPSNLVPYPLPRKNRSIAYVTCIYPTELVDDYRPAVLQKLLSHLREEGYRELQVVAGRHTPFPNGPASFFRRHRFVEIKEVDRVCLAEGEEELILMSRKV